MSSLVIDLVAGARPNFMKVAPILRALRSRGTALVPRLVHTGQHYDAAMSDVFFKQLEIPEPDVRLGVGSGTHGAQTARIIESYESHLLQADPRPAGVVVVGDVNSTMACTIAAAKLCIPVAHVEAGLRSFDRTMPEEINRIVTDALSDILLVSEPSGEKNLLREGIDTTKILMVGNVMIDTLVHQLPAIAGCDVQQRYGCQDRYAYVTLHRPSNVDDPARLEHLVEILERLAQRITVVFPVHPRTRGRLDDGGLLARLQQNANIRLLAPLGYRENVALIRSATVVLTDSGGLQEETTFLGVPCLTLRPNTERPVTVDVGTSTLIGDALHQIEPLVVDVLEGRYKKTAPIPLWDGHAAERIADVLLERWT